MLTDNTGWVDDIKNTISSIDSSKGAVSSKTQELLDIINSKIDILADADNYESVEEISSMLQLIDNKIDVISESGNSSDDYFEELTSMVQTIDNKIDVISENGNNSDGHLEDLTSMVQAIDNKIDTLSQNDDSFENVEQLNEITTMLETLNHKLDVIADSESYLETESSFEEIRNLILEQQDYIKQLEPSEKLDTFKTCLDDIAKQLDSFIASSTENDDTDSVTPEVIQNNLKEMKNSIMSAVVDIFNQVSFVEESEDIKDFVEEKTNKINENLESVTQQLKQLASSDNSSEYTYSMQDIETDLTKMRMALNEISRSNTFESSAAPYLNTITDSLNRITYSVDSLTQDEIQNLKTDINGLKTETQNLLATSNESYNALNSDLTNKVSIVASLVKKSNETTDVMRKALIYIGEWIDSASESMNKISSNSEDISVIKSAIETFGQAIPNQAKILSEIEENIESQHEKLQHFDKSISKIENLEEIFARQEERIDRLEANIDKVLSAIEDIDDESITRKIDKIDKQIAKLSTNIEKLASYVDE
jgi:chromosome segregation ATPase